MQLPLLLAVSITFIAKAHSQITGTYPVQLVATGVPDPEDGTDLSNYPECAVRESNFSPVAAHALISLIACLWCEFHSSPSAQLLQYYVARSSMQS